MDWADLVPYILGDHGGHLFGFMALSIAGWVARSIDKMRGSVEELNVKLAVVINQQADHDRRITRLEDHR